MTRVNRKIVKNLLFKIHDHADRSLKHRQKDFFILYNSEGRTATKCKGKLNVKCNNAFRFALRYDDCLVHDLLNTIKRNTKGSRRQDIVMSPFLHNN